jgi:hypothetical protein
LDETQRWLKSSHPAHYEKFVTFPVRLPARESGLQQATGPVRVKVQAELPDEIDEYVVDCTLRVVR